MVNPTNQGTLLLQGLPSGLCVLSNVPAGAYSLYLFGANPDGTRGASFVVSNTGVPRAGLAATINPNAVAGTGPLNSWVLGQSYVVFDHVVPDATGRIAISWLPVSNAISGLSGEGDFNGLQLVPASLDSTVPATSPPSIVVQPFNSIFGGGATATLVVDARGNPAPAVEWWQTNADGTVSDTGQSGSTLSIPNFASGNAGSYFAIATSSSITATSAVAVLGISTTPTIISQSPTNGLSMVAGQSLTLTVAATGAAPTYNWYSNTTLVATTSGAAVAAYNGTAVDYSGTTASYTITPSAACTLTCLVANSYLPAGVGDTAIAVTVIPQLTGTYDTFILGQNPIAYWPLNEGPGTNTAYNYSISGGPALDGAIQEFAEAPNVLGVPGPALFGFSGANTGISVGLVNNAGTPGADLVAANYCGTENALSAARSGTGILVNGSALELTGNFTVALWALIPQSLNLGNQGYLFGQQNSANGNAVFLGQNGNENWSTVNNTTLNGGPTYADGNWHFWVFINNGHHGSNYVDNVLVESGSYHANASYSSVPVTTIGSDSPGGFTRNWNGDICRMAVFNTAFTAAQVASLYNNAGVQPIITVNPPAVIVANAGTAVSIGPINAAGSMPLNYQWYVLPVAGGGPNAVANGVRISGAVGTTAANLVINPVEAMDAGTYYVTVNNGFGTPPSSTSVVLTVNTAASETIYAGQSPTFTVGTGATSYQWSTNGAPVAGATSSTLTLASLTTAANNGETVSCLINGTISSATYTLSVVAAPTDAYAAAVLLDGPLAYFRLDETDNGSGDNGVITHDYVGGNNGVYVDANPGVTSEVMLGVAGFPYASPLAANTDTAAAFGTLGQSTTSGYAGYSNSFAGYIPINLAQPQGSNGEFSVEAWVYGQAGQHNGGIVTKGYGLGANDSAIGFFEQFTLQNADIGTSGSRYEFSVRDALGNLATFYTTSGVIGSTPGWQHIAGVYDQANSNIVLYVNGLPATSGATITKPIASNGVMNTLVPVSIGAKQVENTSGNYDGQWNGTVDEVAIYPKALTSNEVQNHYFAAGVVPIFLIEPTNVPSIGYIGQTNPPLGSSVTLTVLGFGSPTLHYQWYDNNGGTPIAVNSAAEPGNTGATSPTLTLKNVSTINAGGTVNTIGSGVFFCAISNPYGTTNSATVTLNPVSGPPIITSDLPPTTYALLGSSAVFTVGVSGTFPQTNAWSFNNGTTTVQIQTGGRYTITGGDSPTLTIANATLADQGTYQVFITNSASYPYPSSSTPSALVVELEPTLNGTGIGWSAVVGSGTATPFFPSNNALQITTAGVNGQDNNFWLNTPVYIGAFQASFTYGDFNTATYSADASSFTIQNSAAGTNAAGGGDVAINGITPSVSLQFTLWGVEQNGVSGYGWGTNGASVEDAQTSQFRLNENPSTPGGYVADNQTKVMNITYIGGYLSLSVSNTTTANVGSTNFYVGDITQILGTNVALIGFTGACGGYNMTQIFGDFTFTPIPTLSAVLSAKNVVLAWPNAAGLNGYVLQSCATVNGTYTTVSGTPPVVNGNFQVTVPVPSGAGAKFYRLYLP